jgi:peptidoglycan-associated lipoprotein
MLRLQFALAAVVTLAAASCSHQQKLDRQATAPTPPRPAPIVRAPAPAPSPVAFEEPKNKEAGAVYFDFDSAVLRDDARPVLQTVAESVRERPAKVQIQGNCDELGTVEYNLALGDQRARAAKEYLVHMGVPADRIATISYGAQKPKYPGHDDGARAKNRRDDLVVR